MSPTPPRRCSRSARGSSVQPSAVIDHLARHAGLAQGMAQVIAALPLDAARRQLFLPLQLLQQHGSGMEEVFAGKQTPGARAAIDQLAGEARRHLGTAFELLTTCAAAGAAGVPAAGAGSPRPEAHVARRRRSVRTALDVAVADLVDAVARVAVAGVWRVVGRTAVVIAARSEASPDSHPARSTRWIASLRVAMTPGTGYCANSIRCSRS